MRSNSISLTDLMRVFHGDAPAAQLEACQQKGGHYFALHVEFMRPNVMALPAIFYLPTKV